MEVHFSRQCYSRAAPPCDFSFMKIPTLERFFDLNQPPRKRRIGSPGENGTQFKYQSRAIWLSHNRLSSIKDVCLLKNLVESLEWLDISHNKIVNIPDDIISLQQLKILYLHDNRIRYLVQIAKLKVLPHLEMLTVMGNPVQDVPQYRRHILKVMPYLRKLDHSLVTSDDKMPIFLD